MGTMESLEEAIDLLRMTYGDGHPSFLDLTIDELKLHSEKNLDYAGNGRPLGNFERVSDILALYPGLKLSDPVVVALVYSLKQVDAVLHMLSTGREGAIEGIDSRLADVHTYAKLARILQTEKQEVRIPDA